MAERNPKALLPRISSNVPVAGGSAKPNTTVWVVGMIISLLMCVVLACVIMFAFTLLTGSDAASEARLLMV